MSYEFSWLWFAVGVLALAIGVLFVRFYKQISDNMLSGAASYERCKLVGVIICVVGFLMMFNLHNFIFGLLVGLFFKGM